MLLYGQLILVFLCARSILSLNIDDEFFSDQLLELLEDEEWEEEAERVKRDTIQKINDVEYEEESTEDKESHVREARDHYWTRKRGWNTSDYDDFYYYSYVPNFLNWNWFGFRRNKRDVEEQETTSTTENNEVNENRKSGYHNIGAPFNMVFQKPNFGSRPFPMKCCRIEEDVPDSPSSSPVPSTIDNTISHVKRTCHREIQNRKRKFLKSRNFTDDQIEAENDGFLNFFSCEKLNRTRMEIICLTDCVGQKFNIVDDAGKFNVEKTKKFMLENFAVTEWEKAISDDVVDKCIKEISVTSRSTNVTTTVELDGSKCNTQATQFIYCVGQQYFLECPVEKLKNKRCVKLQEKLRTKI